MHSNFKLPSKHSSSSSGSLKILNLNDLDNLIDDRSPRKDLFDILLEDGPFTLNAFPSLNFSKLQHDQ